MVRFCGSEHSAPTSGTSHLDSLVFVGSKPPSSVCVCGYQANENIDIALINPQGEVIASRAATVDAGALPQVEEVQYELAEFEFIPVLTIAEAIPDDPPHLLGETMNLNLMKFIANQAEDTSHDQPANKMVIKAELLELDPNALQHTKLSLGNNMLNLKHIEFIGDPELKLVENTTLYCKSINELRDFTFLPFDALGEYKIQVSGAQTSVGYTFDLLPLEEPLIIFVEREDYVGYVLAGFHPSEMVTILEYSRDGDLISEYEADMDEQGVLLLDDVPSYRYLFAVREDFSFVPTMVYDGLFRIKPLPGPPLNYDLVVEQNPDNAYAYYQRGLSRLFNDEQKAAEDFQTAIDLASPAQRHLQAQAKEKLEGLNY
jgi:hypothetical protein